MFIKLRISPHVDALTTCALVYFEVPYGKETDRFWHNNMHSERNGCWVSQDELILLDQDHAALYKADFVCFPPHHSLKTSPVPLVQSQNHVPSISLWYGSTHSLSLMKAKSYSIKQHTSLKSITKPEHLASFFKKQMSVEISLKVFAAKSTGLRVLQGIINLI